MSPAPPCDHNRQVRIREMDSRVATIKPKLSKLPTQRTQEFCKQINEPPDSLPQPHLRPQSQRAQSQPQLPLSQPPQQVQQQGLRKRKNCQRVLATRKTDL